jgi:hypothetical protein
MEEFKNLSVWDLLNFLKIRVKQNADTIQSNVLVLNTLKDKLGLSSAELLKINAIAQKNAELASENNKLLTLFYDIYKLQGNYFYDVPKENALVTNISKNNFKSEEELFNYFMEKTINGDIPIDITHPLKSDAKFLASLYRHCLQLEQYEKCAAIKRLKESSL